MEEIKLKPTIAMCIRHRVYIDDQSTICEKCERDMLSVYYRFKFGMLTKNEVLQITTI